MTWSIPVRIESQELSSHFESFVCKRVSVESNEISPFSYVIYAMKWRPTWYW